MHPRLPDSQNPLHGKTDAGDADPTAKSHKNRFTSRSYQFYKIGMKSYSSHCHDYQKFTDFFHGTGHCRRQGKNSRKDGCQYEKKDKKWKNLFKRKTAACRKPPFSRFFHLPYCQCKGDRNDRQRPCQFHDGCCFQRMASVYAIPGSCCRSHRRS